MATIRSLVVSIGVDNSKLAKGMKDGEQQVERFTSRIKAASVSVGTLVKGILAAEVAKKVFEAVFDEFEQARARLAESGDVGVLKMNAALGETESAIDRLTDRVLTIWAPSIASVADIVTDIVTGLDTALDKGRELGNKLTDWTDTLADYLVPDFVEPPKPKEIADASGIFGALKNGIEAGEKLGSVLGEAGARLKKDLDESNERMREARERFAKGFLDVGQTLGAGLAAGLKKAEGFLAKVEAAGKRFESMREMAADIREQIKTPEERFAAEAEKIKELVAGGFLSRIEGIKRVEQIAPEVAIKERPSVVSNQAFVVGSQEVFAAYARFRAGEQMGRNPQKEGNDLLRKVVDVLKVIERNTDQGDEVVQI